METAFPQTGTRTQDPELLAQTSVSFSVCESGNLRTSLLCHNQGHYSSGEMGQTVTRQASQSRKQVQREGDWPKTTHKITMTWAKNTPEPWN